LSKTCLSAADTTLGKIVFKAHQNPPFDSAMARFRPFSAFRAGWHGPCDIPFEPDEMLTNQ
jgi:hypothetical protein